MRSEKDSRIEEESLKITKRETKESEVKKRKAKESEAKEREAKEREAKEREAKERETKEREAKEREAKESEVKKREAKGRETKGRGTKRKELQRERAGRAAEGILQLLFPRRCPVCDGIVQPSGEKICLECMCSLRVITPPWCMRCGKKLPEEGEYCADCAEKERSFVRGRALYEYSSVAQSVYRFKYGGRREYAEYFGEEMAEYLGEFIRRVRPDGLVPIPLHESRRRRRGYNQAELLAKAAGARLGLPVYGGLLRRVKKTPPLKELNARERQNNLKKAFNVAQNDVKSKVYILVDDIYTTGSTVEEAAKVLMEAGAAAVYFVALAAV